MHARTIMAASTLLLALTDSAMAKDDTVKTEIRRGNSSAIVVQSGDPKSATVHVERRPGYVKIEQHSRGSSATVIQIDESAGGKR